VEPFDVDLSTAVLAAVIVAGGVGRALRSGLAQQLAPRQA
jgi:ABC-type proline/glycine betaine transport system permease subunit